MMTKDKIMDILELGLKNDGKSFYTNEEKADIIESYFKDTSEIYKQGWNDGYLECQKTIITSDEESKIVFDRGWKVGYDRGVRDAQTPSGW